MNGCNYDGNCGNTHNPHENGDDENVGDVVSGSYDGNDDDDNNADDDEHTDDKENLVAP